MLAPQCVYEHSHPAHCSQFLQCPSISLILTYHNPTTMYGEEKKPGDELAPVVTSSYGDVEDLSKPTREVDAVFGEINEDGPNYKDVSRVRSRC